MKIDEIHINRPFLGVRRITDELCEKGHEINHERIHRLMQIMGIEAIYPKPNTSKSNPAHKIYPYLLRNLDINRPNQVWATDITFAGERAKGRVATVAIDVMKFILPVKVGDVMCIYGSVVRVGRTSLGLQIEAWAMRGRFGNRENVTEAKFTSVAIDNDGAPREVSAED